MMKILIIKLCLINLLMIIINIDKTSNIGLALIYNPIKNMLHHQKIVRKKILILLTNLLIYVRFMKTLLLHIIDTKIKNHNIVLKLDQMNLKKIIILILLILHFFQEKKIFKILLLEIMCLKKLFKIVLQMLKEIYKKKITFLHLRELIQLIQIHKVKI